MEFESSQATAIRLNVNVRTVQKWAKDGKIPGAKQVGRTWMIPVNAQGPLDTETSSLEEEQVEKVKNTGAGNTRIENEKIENKRIMPLLSSSFELGHCFEYIETFLDSDERAIAKGEYYYYTGQNEKAVAIVEKYLNHSDICIALSACMIYAFAILEIGGEGKKAHLSLMGIEYMKKYVMDILEDNCSSKVRASGIFIIRSSSALFHVPSRIAPPLEEEIAYLPDGIKLFGAYVLAHEAYLKNEYERSLGIVQTALLFFQESYPIAEIYLNLMAATDLAILKRSKEAKISFEKAWNLAQKDSLIQSFVEHNGILHGMIEVCMKKQWPEKFKQITEESKKFNKGWVKVHKEETGRIVTDCLTPTEFSIAMLYNKGWTVKEVSAHIEMSERTIKHHISVIYEKLGISSRNELADYLRH